MQLEQLEAHALAWSVDALHVASGGGCVVGACSAGMATWLYVVANHTVDLSFQRWSGGANRRRRRRRVWVGGARGATCAGAPVVRVAMACVGRDRVAAVVNGTWPP